MKLKRKKINLVRKIYFKIKDGDKTHYLIERAYASESDGFIEEEMIDEKRYLKAIEQGENTKEVDIEEARPNIIYVVRQTA